MRKKIIVPILILLVLAAWLVLRHHKPLPEPAVLQPPQSQTPSNSTAPYFSNTVSQTTSITTVFIRPDYIDEDHWNQLMLVRQLALEQNQPVEFYGRVLDENDQPVAGAMLDLKLTRTDEQMFATTNFFSRNMGDEALTMPLKLISDSSGWIRLSGFTGSFLRVEALKKEGYQGKDYYGGISFERHGVRNPSSDILMTNAWNPQKGFVFHLQKD